MLRADRKLDADFGWMIYNSLKLNGHGMALNVFWIGNACITGWAFGQLGKKSGQTART